MSSIPVRLDKAGVFLFRAPQQINATIDRELLVVFAVPDHKAVGAVIHDTRNPTRDLIERLDTLFEKVTLGLGVGAAPIHAKLFGVSHGHPTTIFAVRAWLARKGVYTAAEDFGRNAARNILIHADTGAVGVSYAEAYGLQHPSLLTKGSARERFDVPEEATVLVLTESPVTRVLARQAIEDLSGYAAEVPERPIEILSTKPATEFPYGCVLIFDDVGHSAAGNWIEMLAEFHSGVRVLWSGDNIPARLPPSVRRLAPLHPETIVDFKDAFVRAAVGDVIMFPAGFSK